MMILDLESLPVRRRARWSSRLAVWCLVLLTLWPLSPRARAEADGAPAPGSAGNSCKQAVPLEDLRDEIGAAEDAVRKTPSSALEALARAEAMLPCLRAPVEAKLLVDLFRLRAVASLLLKNRGGAQEAFVRAAASFPDMECPASLTGYGNNAFTRDAIGLCNVAVSAVAQSLVGIEFTNHRSLEKLFFNGVERSLDESTVYVEVAPGKHLLQIEHRDGVRGLWLQVKPPLDEDARAQRFDLVKLGLVPEKKTTVVVGSIRLEGLEPGSEVVLDGRTRQDLPLLRNVEVGERYLMIRLPDGSVLGGTVTVKQDEETVYKLALEPAGRSDSPGLSLDRNKVVGFGILGGAVLSAVGSGLTFNMAFDRYALADEQKATYDALTTGSAADFGAPYDQALAYQSEGNRFQTIGWVLGGVAVAAAGAGSYFLFFAGSGDDGFVKLEPWLAPVPGQRGEKGGVALGLHGRF